ncbi:LysR family transcriptional regulator [Nocardia donostiensis]|uniref:LysR family transcriptional regulator n=1 Tax=Nocardia donostiensis TaxID=1538463 RepID=A0A1W0BKB3_9NOCA|nr:LysR family transcriptional regulator [Nocardia donostiensis]ONM48962.1 LysR family transcriptional regulator [Nocardia donostiensis]OQS22972.1 LysR family transcriptional regulator [Nocardia donostiensis]
MDVHGRELRYFVAVAEQLNFTRAAEGLFVSQPALSKQIRMLERQLGARLFERDGRSVRLTPVGEALLPHARRMLALWDQARAEVDTAKAAQLASLVIGISTSPGRGLLPAVRSRFATAFPSAKPVLRQVAWADPTAGLGDSTTDVAYVWLPLTDAARYEWIVVAHEPRLVALPETHRLAAQETVDFADLLDDPFLALPESAGTLRDYWLALDARDGHPPIIGGEVSSTEETYEAVRGGDGIVLLAAGNASLVIHDGIVAREVRGITPSELALAWRRDDHRPLVRGYAEACRLALAGSGIHR